MAAWSEQQTRERLMDDYIDTDPIMIELTRPVKATTIAGGMIEAGVVIIDPQKFFFMPFKRRLTREIKFNPQSYGEDEVEYIDYILIFNKDVDIEQGDRFESIDGRLELGWYEILFVSPRQWDRRQAGILYRG